MPLNKDLVKWLVAQCALFMLFTAPYAPIIWLQR